MHQSMKQPVACAVLRRFGLLMGATLALFFGILIPWLWGLDWPRWPWIAAAIFFTAALTRASLLLPVLRIWQRIGAAAGWLNTRMLLGAVFFLMVLPIGLILRLFNDPMERHLDAGAESYRKPSRQPLTRNLERPF